MRMYTLSGLRGDWTVVHVGEVPAIHGLNSRALHNLRISLCLVVVEVVLVEVVVVVVVVVICLI